MFVPEINGPILMVLVIWTAVNIFKTNRKKKRDEAAARQAHRRMREASAREVAKPQDFDELAIDLAAIDADMANSAPVSAE